MKLQYPTHISKKKIVLIAGIVLLFAGLLIASLMLSNRAKIKRYCISDEKYEEKISVLNIADDSFEVNLKFNESTVYLINNELWCSINENERSKDKWRIYSTGKNELRLAIKESYYEKCSIEDNIPLTLLLYSGNEYREYQLHISTVPFFFLEADGEIGENEVTMTANGHSGTVSVRGRTSRSQPKASYDIKLNSDYSFENMRNGKNWVLNSMFDDQERVRDYFCSNLWFDSCATDNQFGLTIGYEYRYVELFLNDSYEGLYILGYKPGQDVFDIHNGEYLYKKDSWNVCKLVGNKTKKFEIDAWDAFNGEYYEDIINAIDIWLFTNFCAAVDNTGSNYYMALKKYEAKFTAVYCPWDLDLSYGNTWDESKEWCIGQYEVQTDYLTPMYLCMAHNQIVEKNVEYTQIAKTRYETLRKTWWSNSAIEDRINECQNKIFDSGAYIRDVKRWPESISQDDELKLTEFKEYVMRRASWMDGYMLSISG